MQGYYHESTESLPQSAKLLAERYKTRTCKKFMAKGSCPYYGRCMFAHGHHEVRTVAMNLRDGLVTEDAIKAFKETKQPQNHQVPFIDFSVEAAVDVYVGLPQHHVVPPCEEAACQPACSAHLAKPAKVLVSVAEWNEFEEAELSWASASCSTPCNAAPVFTHNPYYAALAN